MTSTTLPPQSDISPDGWDRDYLAEMDALIDAHTENGDWVAAVVAARIRGLLVETDLDLLDGWLYAMAEDSLRRYIGNRTGRRRQRDRRNADARTFAEHRAKFEEGEIDGQEFTGLFHSVFVVDAAGTRKEAGDMTGTEHRFVAGKYEHTANMTRMQAAFHKAVAAKAGDHRVADIMTEDEYERLYRSLTGRKNKP